MARVSLFVVVIIASSSCAVQKQSSNHDSFHAAVNGKTVDFDFVAKLADDVSTKNFDEIDAVYGWDDHASKLYDPEMVRGINAGRLKSAAAEGVHEFSFHFSIPDGVSLGDVTVNRAFFYRAKEPWLTWIDKSVTPEVRYLPKNGQQLNVDVDGDGRMTISFPHLDLVDTCDNPLALDDAEIDAKLVDSKSVSSEAMHLLAANSVDASEIEGNAALTTDQGPFNDLIPLMAPPDSSSSTYDLLLTNLCATSPMTSFGVSLTPAQTAPATYNASDVTITGFTGTSDHPDIYLGVTGSVTVNAFDDFVDMDVSAPVDLEHVVFDAAGNASLDDSKHMHVSGGHIHATVSAL